MRRELIREAVLPISAVILILAAGWMAYSYFTRHTTAAAIRMSIQPPAGSVIQSFAVSPDGRFLAFTASSQGKFLLWLRTIDSLTPQLVPGTEGASYPFWSPDGKSVAFFTPGKLKRDRGCGRTSRKSICDVMNARGGAGTLTACHCASGGEEMRSLYTWLKQAGGNAGAGSWKAVNHCNRCSLNFSRTTAGISVPFRPVSRLSGGARWIRRSLHFVLKARFSGSLLAGGLAAVRRQIMAHWFRSHWPDAQTSGAFGASVPSSRR